MGKIEEKPNIDAPGVALARTMDRGSTFASCPAEDRPDPCIIIIVGASGDLTSRKIVPALFRLFVHGDLPDPFVVVGCARTNMDDKGFRTKMKKALNDSDSLD